MADIPHVWPGYIQTEEQQFTAAVSEYTGQRMGAAMNYLFDESNSLQSQITNNDAATNKIQLLGPYNFSTVGSGTSFPNITTFTARGGPIILTAISGSFSGTTGNLLQFGFRRNGTNIVNIITNDLNISLGIRGFSAMSSAVGNTFTHVYPIIVDYIQPAAGTLMTYDFIFGNLSSNTRTISGFEFTLVY